MRYIKRALALASLLLCLGAGVGLVALQARASKLLSIQSGSMEPAISKGDLVVVTRIPLAKLSAGDVVTFINPANPQQTITHRIQGFAEDRAGSRQIITKGDANPTDDGVVSASAIIGKQQLTVPLLGYGLDFVRRPLGLLLLIYMPALGVVVTEIRRLMAYYRAREPYVLPEFGERRRGRRRAGTAAGCLLLIVALTAPQVRAAFLAEATLAGNRISVNNTPTENELLIERTVVLCAPGDPTLADHAEIALRNMKREAVDVSGWYIESAAGERLMTFPAGTVFAARSTIEVDAAVADGITHGGGSIKLFTAAEETADTHDWARGTVVCHLS